MSNKTRLDVLLVERGLEQTRQRAQAMIMSGLVFVDGQRVDVRTKSRTRAGTDPPARAGDDHERARLCGRAARG